jgi:hypothetical protein
MKLQNDLTTPEQSKRLLELGVPKWTANIKYESESIYPSFVDTLGFCDTGIEDDGYEKYTIKYSPSWSVGRLCEIVRICYVGQLPCTCYPVGAINIVQYMVDAIAYMAYYGLLDFSRLEE